MAGGLMDGIKPLPGPMLTSHESNFAVSAQAILLNNELETYTFNSLRPSDAYMQQ